MGLRLLTPDSLDESGQRAAAVFGSRFPRSDREGRSGRFIGDEAINLQSEPGGRQLSLGDQHGASLVG